MDSDNNNTYTDVNAQTIDSWVRDGWEWGKPVNHEECDRARAGEWRLFLTPAKPVPRQWYPPLAGARVLGLACGGAQQMPVLALLGAHCTVLDYSEEQLASERLVAQREGYSIEIVRADMTKPLPFADDTFDLIFHPVSNCYIEHVEPVWRECYRILKKGGVLLAGLDNGINYVYDEEETALCHKLPFNPLQDKALYEESIRKGWGVQFSHGIEEQIGGQLRAGLRLEDVFQDTNGSGPLHEHGVPAFFATRSVKP